MEYSIVIPAYNEADRIAATITQITTFMRTFSDAYEVIVVDDGSVDNTADIVEDYSRENRDVKVIRNPHKGKGPSVWKGVMSSSGKYIYMCDTDLAAPISELKKLSVWLIDQDYDIVIASREGVGAERIGEPFYRHLMGRVFNYVVQLLALPGIKDSQCGFKLFKAEVAMDIFSRLKIYGDNAPLQKKAYLGAFDVEVLYLAKKMGLRVKAVPVTWTYVKTTRLNPILDSIKMPLDVLKIRVNDLKGLYNTAPK
ncbi:glycosyltransferase family 2 protein [Patescibacteria group bacterium]|nr:glycosyltransferase family 2 protein [Patescibacteria group bacterium]